MSLSLCREIFPLLLVGILMLISGCGEHPDLPTTIAMMQDFGANDTSYVRINPDWDNAHGFGFQSPEDIQVGRDGLLYVINHNLELGEGGQVMQLNRAGIVIRRNLFADIDPTHLIMGIGQDSKLNLFMVNGTDKIYAWNQYAADIGVQSILHEVTLRHEQSGEEIVLDYLHNPVWIIYEEYQDELADRRFQVVQVTASDDPDSLTTFQSEYLFYTDVSRLGSQFTDVDGGVDRSEIVYVSDRFTDRIIGLDVKLYRAMLLNNNVVAYTYRGAYDTQKIVVTFGQGQGSVNNPTGLFSERISSSQAAIYFTQISGNFLVQKLTGSGGQWFFNLSHTPAGEPEVLHLEYFGTPYAIAVGEKDEKGLGLFYVADSAQNRVPAFHPNGFLFREVAVEELLIDLQTGDHLANVLASLGREFSPSLNPGLELNFIVENDTTLSIQFPILNGPKGVATLEGMVYIADTGNNRILRFRRSDANTYLPKEE